MEEDFTIYQLGQATDRANSILWVQIPSEASSGYSDYYLDMDTLLAAEQARLDTNEDAIDVLEVEMAEQQELSSKTYDAAKGTFTKTQAANSILAEVCFTTITDSPTVSIGTISGGTDLLSSREVEDGFKIATINKYTATSRTIYITITGGTCDIVTFSRLNLNS